MNSHHNNSSDLNLDDALKFLNALAPSSGHVDLRLIMDKGDGVKAITSFIPTRENLQKLGTDNHKGYGIFATINQTDGKGVAASNITQVRALFVDFDDPDRDNLAVISSMGLQPNMVVESSPGKFHAYWFVNDCPLEVFKSTQLALCKKFLSDPSISDLPRIMRLPGFCHQKGEAFVTRIISTCDKQYRYEDVTGSLELNLDTINAGGASFNQGKLSDNYNNEGRRLELTVELDSARGGQILEDLHAQDGPMQYLLSLGYGSKHEEFVRLSANHEPYLDTIHGKRAKELLDEYLQQVGGNYNAHENERRLGTFSQGHPLTIFAIADESGWWNPNKVYSAGYCIEDAIYKLGKPDKNGEPTKSRICSWMVVSGRTRGLNGYDHGYLVQWKDKDNHMKEQATPASALHDPNQLIETLTNAGLSIVPGKVPDTLRYIEGFKAKTVVDCATRTGWYEDGSYVLPAQSFRPDGNKTRLLLQGAGAVKNITSVNGQLNDWQTNVCQKCAGNSRLVMSVCIALAAPLLKLLKLENGGFHLCGDSSLGKSTALKVAASVYGPPDYMKTWKSTDTALEYMAAAYNDMPLPLDELKQAAPETISSATYMLANGRGKERGKKEGGVRKVTEWRTLVLSSGERTPAELLKERGGIHAGQEVRLINIPADTGKHGLFETLHDIGSGEHFSNTLVTNAANYYGSAGEAWIQHLVNERDNVIKSACKLMASFIDSTTSDKFDGQLKRVLSKFSLLAAAGELATTANITGWRSGEAIKALKKTFDDYLKVRGNTGKNEDHDIVDKVRASLMSHGNARFENISDFSNNRYKVQNQLGYKTRVDNQCEYLEEYDDFAPSNDEAKVAPKTYYYLVTKQGLPQLAAGYSASKIATVLDERGYLATSPGRKQKKWNPSNTRGSMQGSWFYTIKPEIFDENEE